MSMTTIFKVISIQFGNHTSRRRVITGWKLYPNPHDSNSMNSLLKASEEHWNGVTQKAVEVFMEGLWEEFTSAQPAKPAAHRAQGENTSGIPAEPAQPLRLWITETRAELDLQDSPHPALAPWLQVPIPQRFWVGFFTTPHCLFLSLLMPDQTLGWSFTENCPTRFQELFH